MLCVEFRLYIVILFRCVSIATTDRLQSQQHSNDSGLTTLHQIKYNLPNDSQIPKAIIISVNNEVKFGRAAIRERKTFRRRPARSIWMDSVVNGSHSSRTNYLLLSNLCWSSARSTHFATAKLHGHRPQWPMDVIKINESRSIVEVSVDDDRLITKIEKSIRSNDQLIGGAVIFGGHVCAWRALD